MQDGALIDLEALLAPIEGAEPAGVPVAYEVRQKLEDLRKEVRPEDFSPKDPQRPKEAVTADWRGIVRLATTTLTEKSKDLQVAARLTEALTKEHGFAGCHAGLQLLHGLTTDCWDRLQPRIEEPDDLEARAGPFDWLDDPDRGARFPITLRSTPLVAQHNWFVWRGTAPSKITREELDRAAAAAPAKAVLDTIAAIDGSLAVLNSLALTLQERLADFAPAMLQLRQVLDECRVVAFPIAQSKGYGAVLPQAAVETEAEVGVESNGVVESGTVAAAKTNTREDIYRQLARLADELQRLEPHSPIPYLLQRAVRLGGMPFHLLVQELISDDTVKTSLTRDMGLPEPTPPG